jgi:NAD(P)H-hydrate epimerase
MQILTKSQAFAADKSAMNEFGVPSAILMENAALSSFNIIKNYISRDMRICVLCGTGNNGGDGYAIARHLFSNSYNVEVFSFGDKSKMSIETLNNYEIARKLNFKMNDCDFDVISQLILNDYDCYIESLIGVGGSENLKENVSNLLEKINNLKGFKIAIDVPAGLNSDTGLADKNAFKSDLTISMFAPKIGMYLNDGKNICGTIQTAYLGVPSDIAENLSTTRILEKGDIRKILKFRDDNGSKFNYGRVLIIAGSEKYPGAAALSANAAVRAGAGLVELASTSYHNSLFPEVIQIKLSANDDGTISESNLEMLNKHIEKCDSLAIGPGLGTNDNTISMIKTILKKFNSKKIIIDADGLNALDIAEKYNKNLVITPHIYEFCKLLKIQYSEIEKDEYETVLKYSQELNCNIHLKFRPSITTDGINSTFTINGNSGMATGGSGDVLTGIIASFMAQGISSYNAASLGAFVHSSAGDLYIKNNSKESLRASDLIENLKFCL